MSRLLKMVALLLATLWLPATVHCQLENLGLDALFACADSASEDGHADGAPCTDDGCQTIESGQVLTGKARLDLVLPAAFGCVSAFCLFEIRTPEPAAEMIASCQDETLPLRRTWQFDRRAALPARAPGLNTIRA